MSFLSWPQWVNNSTRASVCNITKTVISPQWMQDVIIMFLPREVVLTQYWCCYYVLGPLGSWWWPCYIWRHNMETTSALLALCGGNPLQWCHNEHDGISNHWHLDCLLNRLFRHRSKKTSKLHVTGLCEGNPPVTDGFPSQRAQWCGKYFHLMTSSCHPLTKAGATKHFSLLLTEHVVEQTYMLSVICNTMGPMWHHFNSK